jgi:hypothetical protein
MPGDRDPRDYSPHVMSNWLEGMVAAYVAQIAALPLFGGAGIKVERKNLSTDLKSRAWKNTTICV